VGIAMRTATRRAEGSNDDFADGDGLSVVEGARVVVSGISGVMAAVTGRGRGELSRFGLRHGVTSRAMREGAVSGVGALASGITCSTDCVLTYDAAKGMIASQSNSSGFPLLAAEPFTSRTNAS
jgi:hypothetical protein